MNQRGTPAPYFKSLNRPFLIFGIDRSLFFLFIGLSLPIAFSAHFTLGMNIIALLIFFIGYGCGLALTRSDPYFLILYRQHIRYQKHYSAQPLINAPIVAAHASVPPSRPRRKVQ